MNIAQFTQEFPDLCAASKKLHANPPNENRCHSGHTFIHDLTVAALCLKIDPNEPIAIMAACAAMVHSVDHCVEKDKVKDTIKYMVEENLSHILSAPMRSAVAEAAIRHKELNRDDQLTVQITLMDADRLANLSLVTALNLARTAPKERPTLELAHLDEENPATTYRDPQSTLDEIRTHFQYIPMLRMEKAKEIGHEYAIELSKFVGRLGDQISELGLEDVAI
ncbi:MAG TPA: hypothetical protein VFT82_02700 [Candidatus Paceibacterota bacterium]|nr:hypothetical protein [Candidatus Paceibacterota bacterium]